MLDLTPVVQPILAALGMVMTGMFAVYVPKAIDAFTKRTGVIVTEQQRATVLGAVQTAAGVLETKLDQGALSVAHINVSNPSVLAQASAAIAAVPQAAAALGMTTDGVARMIVGAVDTAPRAAVAVPVVATTQPVATVG